MNKIEIPNISLAALEAGNAEARAALQYGLVDVGFLTLSETGLRKEEIVKVIDAYRSFFALPAGAKAAVDMATTGSNRGWGAPGSEQVDPNANPDYKQVFDCGFSLRQNDPLRAKNLSVYADNQWPDLPEFKDTIADYYDKACAVSMRLLRQIARSIDAEDSYFDDKFDRPMALLRGNGYPPRPDWAGEKDFAIATHTDYGCVTLLATDGVPGLEVRKRGGGWIPVNAEPGTFVVNFGEMLESWSGGQVKATPHRVVGTSEARISVPLFFNPNHDTNVAPFGSGETVLAGDHLEQRFNETYVHLKAG